MMSTAASAQSSTPAERTVAVPTPNGPSDNAPMASSQAEATSTDAQNPNNPPVVNSADPALEAPQTAAPAPEPEAPLPGDVIVTGSRISIAGYKQPTPVTVVGEAILQRDARPTIGDSIRELPAVGSSSSPNNTAGAGNIVAGVTGLDTVNLRNLGVTRTLVLFDGQRVVQSNITGQIDIGTIPTALVQRIDVVTAGASAAWGSDAVSGVVNLILNKNFDGIRASAEGSETYKFDRKSYRLQLAAGTSFAGDRGRIIVAGNMFNAPDNIFANQRSWNKYRQLVNNPAYTPTNSEPRLIHADNVNLAQATLGGLITGPACAVALVAGVCARPNTLVNQQFTGTNGALAPFSPTNISGQVASNADITQGALNNLAIRYKTSSLFAYTSYKITDSVKASLQLNYGTTSSKNNSVPYIRIGNVTIRNDNPFLPDPVRAQMAQLGLSSISVGTTNINNSNLDNLSYDNFVRNSVGVPVATTKRALKRGVFSLDGDLGGGWTWNAYYQRGDVKVVQRTESNVIVGNYNLAVDAVRNAAGQIVCRSTLTNPTNGCVPLNILGTGVASQEAIRYINVQPGQNYQIQRLKEDVTAASVQGKLPFGLPAGNIAVAFGIEGRSERGTIVNDPGAQARIYSVANFPSFRGKYDVREGFLEIDVPLIEDGFVQSLSFNSAGRITRYSTSGQVETWKAGLTSQVNESIRLRGTVSRDIRAPNLNELFSTGLSTLGSAVDPRTNQAVSIFTFASGNSTLQPEVAKTYSGGIVLTPQFAPRFNFSFDYYNINVRNVIASVGSVEVLLRCNRGETTFCPQLVFNGPAGALSQINTFPQNLASLKTDGFDIQADYSMPAFGGDLQFRVLGNYIRTLQQNQLGNVVDAAGAIGPDQAFAGFPRARATASVTYVKEGLSLTAQTRFIGASKLVYNWTSKDVDDNTVPAIAYADLRGSYQVNDQIQVFGTVDNLLNQDPPNVAAGPTQGQTSYYFTPINGTIYDAIGRQYRLGVRVRF